MCAHRTSALVAIVDPSGDRRQLLAATLYALGCRILPLEGAIDDVVWLREQFTTRAPDVLIWDFGGDFAVQCAPLRDLLHSGVLARTALVMTTAAPAAATIDVGNGRGAVQVLGHACTITELMRAVTAAELAPVQG